MRKFFVLLLGMLWFTFNSFGQEKLIAKETQAIPPDLGKDKSTMLVILSPAGFQVNKAMEKAFEENYTGKYTVIRYREQFEPRYQDSVKYRYRFQVYINMEPGQFTRSRSQGGFERQGPSNNYSFGVWDMFTGKDYNLSIAGPAYKKLVEPYVKKLEEQRKKNE